MRIRQAQSADLNHIVELRRDAARWLTSIGSDQWSGASIDESEFRYRVENSIADGETWVAVDTHETVLGTIALDQHTNPGLWSAEEVADSLILHRMIRGNRAPSGTGRQLLQHAIEVARRAGKQWLRLDAWTTNHALHQYYEKMGFQHARTVADHHTLSAALFEYPVFNVIPSNTRMPLIEVDGPDHGNPTSPHHWHRVQSMTVHAPSHYPVDGPLEVSSDSRPLYLWHDEQWFLSDAPPHVPYNTYAKRVLNWENAPNLDPIKRYVIQHQANTPGCRLVLHEADTPSNTQHEEATVRKTP